MFSKRYLSISVLIVFVVLVGVLVSISIEQPKIYEVCRNAMLSVEGYGPWEYQRTSVLPFFAPVRFFPYFFEPVVTFDDGTNTAWCHVQRHGSEWQVTAIWQTMVARLP